MSSIESDRSQDILGSLAMWMICILYYFFSPRLQVAVELSRLVPWDLQRLSVTNSQFESHTCGLRPDRGPKVYPHGSGLVFVYIACPQKGNLRLSGPPSGQGAGGVVQTRDRGSQQSSIRTRYQLHHQRLKRLTQFGEFIGQITLVLEMEERSNRGQQRSSRISRQQAASVGAGG
ncbi:hypothetical protein PoB_002259100 [Plakobranchus ocellatus]|uniref:Uncharacterized protein n=1 Tax=Plakobranchus ocellatus TaxID=259542 RepID=A0AAV3ZNH9_9GAST|nr:hypothetical protein PoB_002259100 [Plakobranchus ocellatus]